MVFKNLLEAVAYCDTVPYTRDPTSNDEIHHATPFILGPHTIGNVLPSVLPALKEYNELNHAPFVMTNESIQFNPDIDNAEKRSAVMKRLVEYWREHQTFEVLSGWRNELYPVYGDDNEPDSIAFVIERASAVLFGISTFGVHLNAYTKKEGGQIFIWIARRALTKPTWPGLLDNCVCYKKKRGIDFFFLTCFI